MRSPEFKADPTAFRREAPLTGDESRVREIADVTFPTPLSPADDSPPTTVITRVVSKGGRLIVRGISADNGRVTKVTVNGQPAKSLSPNFADWEIVLEGARTAGTRIEARSEDEAGNVERTPAVVVMP